jgi:hypothetical protein
MPIPKIVESKSFEEIIADKDTLDTLQSKSYDYILSTSPGTTKTSTIQYHKAYFYYSGSVIDHSTFALKGYQDNFPWLDHASTYATVTTQFQETLTYEEVGSISFDTYAYDSNGDLQNSERSESVYDWVTVEHTPNVTTNTASEKLYVTPNSVGIIVETSETSEALNPSDYADAHTHEEIFTDNAALTHSFKGKEDSSSKPSDTLEFKPEKVVRPELVSANSVISTVSNEESAFISDIFGGVQDVSDYAQMVLDTITSEVYNTTIASMNIHVIGSETKIKQINLREMRVVSSPFSASINQNLVGYTS